MVELVRKWGGQGIRDGTENCSWGMAAAASSLAPAVSAAATATVPTVPVYLHCADVVQVPKQREQAAVVERPTGSEGSISNCCRSVRYVLACCAAAELPAAELPDCHSSLPGQPCTSPSITHRRCL